MSDSLREQLLKAGVVDEKRLERAKREKRQGTKRARGKGGAQAKGGRAEGAAAAAPEVRDSKAEARAALKARAERDREIARKRRLKEERAALKAQVSQIIDQNRVKRDGGEIGYNFVEGRKVKRIWVTARLRDGLANGQYAVVKDGERYEVVPAEVAEKLKLRDPACVVARHDPAKAAEEAAYADRPIPDDLDW